MHIIYRKTIFIIAYINSTFAIRYKTVTPVIDLGKPNEAFEESQQAGTLGKRKQNITFILNDCVKPLSEILIGIFNKTKAFKIERRKRAPYYFLFSNSSSHF